MTEELYNLVTEIKQDCIALLDKLDVVSDALQPDLVIAYSKIVEGSKLIEQQQQRIEELENSLMFLGYCTKCSTIPEHHIDEPFSSCACGTGEDYATRPLQRMQILEYRKQGEALSHD